MSLTKRHQYKYLTEKLKFKYLDLKYREEISTNTDPDLIKDEVSFYNEYYYRLDFYSDWLERINNKYNYIGVEQCISILMGVTELELISYKIILC